MLRTRRSLACVGAGLLLVVGCAEGDSTRQTALDDDAITVGSFDFPESVLLAEIYSQALGGRRLPRRAGLRPRPSASSSGRRCGPGSSSWCPSTPGRRSAFASLGAVDADGRRRAPRTDALATARCARPASPPWPRRRRRTPTRSSSPQETARRHDLAQLSDLARGRRASSSFGGPPECPSRSLCLLGLQERYGLAVRRGRLARRRRAGDPAGAAQRRRAGRACCSRPTRRWTSTSSWPTIAGCSRPRT